MAKYQRNCPYCRKIVGGINPSILEINYALHLKKHEIRGDTLEEGILHRVGHAMWSTPGVGISVFGFLVEERLLTILWFPVIELPIWAWVAGGVVGLGLFFHFLAKQYLDRFRDSTSIVQGWLFNFIIGGLGKGFWNLFLGLLPFYQNPWTILVLAIYSFIIVDVFLMKRSFAKLAKFGETPWKLC